MYVQDERKHHVMAICKAAYLKRKPTSVRILESCIHGSTLVK